MSPKTALSHSASAFASYTDDVDDVASFMPFRRVGPTSGGLLRHFYTRRLMSRQSSESRRTGPVPLLNLSGPDNFGERSTEIEPEQKDAAHEQRINSSKVQVAEHYKEVRQDRLARNRSEATLLVGVTRHDQEVAALLLLGELWRYQKYLLHPRSSEENERRVARISPNDQAPVNFQKSFPKPLDVRLISKLLGDVQVLMRSNHWETDPPASKEKHPYLFTQREISKFASFNQPQNEWLAASFLDDAAPGATTTQPRVVA